MNGKVKNKGTITEEDISMLLQRYQATTILTLLQEVSQVAGKKIDWEAQVKKTSTGISSPREYQMLWQHLAYREPLMEKLEDGEEPLDCESDLEFEVDASPHVSVEASMEAAACVKVLMSSNSSADAGPSTRPIVVAPLTINIPNGQASLLSDKCQASCSSRGLNITIPVSVQKQSLPATIPAEKNDGTGLSGSKPPTKKRRKLWTKEEDEALINAVQKFGEGSWQNILKQGFKHDKTASQLSQRWTILKKQTIKSNGGSVGNPNGKSNNTALTEAQLSTRQAISMALNMPMIGSLPALCSGKANSGDGTAGPLSTSPTPVNPAGSQGPSETPPTFCPKGSNQSQQAIPQGTQKGACTTSKSQITQVKSSGTMKHVIGPNTLIQKAAFAAGGRIATPSTAASHFKAAQSKNAVHIRPGVSLSMTPVSGAKPSISSASSCPSNICQTRTSSLVSSVVPHSVPGTGSHQQAASSSQPPPCSDTWQSSLQQHVDQQKVSDPVLGDAAANAVQNNTNTVQTNSHVMDEVVKVSTCQQTKMVGNDQIHVVNVDGGEDVHVMEESSRLPVNCELQQEAKNDDTVLQIQQEHAADNCISADDGSPAEAKIQEEPIAVTSENLDMVENGNSDTNLSNSKVAVGENVNEERDGNTGATDK